MAGEVLVGRFQSRFMRDEAREGIPLVDQLVEAMELGARWQLADHLMPLVFSTVKVLPQARYRRTCNVFLVMNCAICITKHAGRQGGSVPSFHQFIRTPAVSAWLLS